MNWYISDNGMESCIREECKDSEVNDPIVCEFPYGLEHDEDKARAKLIAAAPDLVAALQQAEQWMIEAKECGCKLPNDVTMSRIRAALAKASAP